MCGIAGVLGGAPEDTTEVVVRRMADRIQHRGPDDAGVWIDRDARVALGHRRLSIVDLSPAGHQPMVSADGRFVIIYNGEIYNHAYLRGALLTEGRFFAWRGHSDTEILLECFGAWGIERTLNAAVGMFAIALWDRQEATLTLARDRMGEKPLYYGWQGNAFLFGSELKALRAHPRFEAKVSRGSLALFLRFNYVPAPYSVYEGIQKLPPGTFLQVRDNGVETAPVPWWVLSDIAQRGTAEPFAGSDDDAIAELDRCLSNAVQGQMVADVPLGALLSGGLDSTLVTALMQAHSPRPVRTFTIGFEEGAYDEANHARAIARHLGTEHTELRLSGNDALDLIPRLPEMYDEPFADSSQLPTHLVMKLARQQVTVALSGDGGDEIFGGYNRYVHVPKVWKRLRWIPASTRRLLASGLLAIPSHTLNRAAGPIATRLGVAQPGDKAHKLGKRIVGVSSPDDLYVSLVSEWPASVVLGARFPANLIDDRARWPQLSDPVARMMALDGMTYLPDDVLVKVDRAAMSMSLETRAPFLDRDVVSFAWSLPMAMKFRAGKGKWILRELLARHVPRALSERPKMGFAIPLDEWLRGPLREWAEALLSERRLREEGYLDPAPVRRAWSDHVSGNASNGYRLWSVLMFQSWLQANAVAP